MPAGPRCSPLLFPLTTNLSYLLFDDVPAAPQVLAGTAGCLAVPTTCDVFLTVLAKAALPPRVIATLDEPP